MAGTIESGKLLRGDVELKIPAEKIKYETRTGIVFDFVDRRIQQEKYRVQFLYNGFFGFIGILASAFISPWFVLFVFHFFRKAMNFGIKYGYIKHMFDLVRRNISV